jgi:Holliday junction resolvasome RuvABC endonuclease subunit
MPYLRFRRWLDELRLTTHGLAEVLYEEVRAHRGTLAAQIYGAFVGHLQAWCEARAIAYAGVPVGTIKRHITGRGDADKEAVIAAVRALGFTPADDNEADALALLDWALRNGGRR